MSETSELTSGQRITLSPNDETSTPRRVHGILSYRTDKSYFLMLGQATLPCEFPKFAWHVVRGEKAPARPQGLPNDPGRRHESV